MREKIRCARAHYSENREDIDRKWNMDGWDLAAEGNGKRFPKIG